MSKKPRFFYVVSRVADRNITASAVIRGNGSFINCNEVRAQVAKDLSEDINDIYVSHWQEFESEQDFLDFHK